MIKTDAKLKISPEILEKLSAEKAGFWTAAHPDGSDSRINADAVLEAGSWLTSLGILSALFQGIRKKYRNRGKTKEDFAAEKEAAQVNRSAGALEELLLEYLRLAREGSVTEESLEELPGALEEIHGYFRAGKLSVPGEKELAEIRRSITDYTSALLEEKGKLPSGEPDDTADDFSRIRDQLILQKKALGISES